MCRFRWRAGMEGRGGRWCSGFGAAVGTTSGSGSSAHGFGGDTDSAHFQQAALAGLDACLLGLYYVLVWPQAWTGCSRGARSSWLLGSGTVGTAVRVAWLGCLT